MLESLRDAEKKKGEIVRIERDRSIEVHDTRNNQQEYVSW